SSGKHTKLPICIPITFGDSFFITELGFYKAKHLAGQWHLNSNVKFQETFFASPVAVDEELRSCYTVSSDYFHKYRKNKKKGNGI
ncbi:MAG: hypothetical protein ACI4EI_09795, partial [Muricoprocola sp.]